VRVPERDDLEDDDRQVRRGKRPVADGEDESPRRKGKKPAGVPGLVFGLAIGSSALAVVLGILLAVVLINGRGDDGKQMGAREQLPNNQPPKVTPNLETEDRRVRWVNTSYNTTISHVEGKTWVQVDNGTGKESLRYTEQARTAEYIELTGSPFGPIRLGAQRMELKQRDKWEWAANGSWVEKPKPVVQTPPQAPPAVPQPPRTVQPALQRVKLSAERIAARDGLIRNMQGNIRRGLSQIEDARSSIRSCEKAMSRANPRGPERPRLAAIIEVRRRSITTLESLVRNSTEQARLAAQIQDGMLASDFQTVMNRLDSLGKEQDLLVKELGNLAVEEKAAIDRPTGRPFQEEGVRGRKASPLDGMLFREGGYGRGRDKPLARTRAK
jgi:hypothetical protein